MIQINPLKSYIDGGVRAALTTPPSASLVFDLPGKAIWVKGVKLKGIDHTYTFNHDNYITLTNTPDKNNPESEDIKIGVNITTLKNVIDTTYNGGTLALLLEGLNTEERTWLAKILHSYINNVLPTTKNIQINGKNYAIYTTEDSLPLFFVPVSLGTTGQILACTSSGLIWVDLIQNTDYRVSLSSATSNSDYRIILKQGADNNPETDFVRFSEYLTFNPYTKTLKINNIKVVTATDIYVGSNAGLVPTATSAQLNYYLRGDGAWVNIATEMAAANTWRPIKVENTDALGSGTNTGTLSFIAGTGITLSWDATNKRIIITNSSPDVNHNTDENVRQVPKTDNVNRPLMMINGSTSAGEQINTSMFSTGIYANASTKMITANGFIKAGSSDNYVLLGGGGHKALSDFSMAHSHPYLSFSSIYPSNTINLNDYFSSSTMYKVYYDYSGSSKIQNGPYESDAGAVINFPTYSGTQVYFNYYNNDVKVRTHYNGHITNWATFITSENIGSQSVNYADSAGYADNADKLDNIDSTGFLAWTGMSASGGSSAPFQTSVDFFNNTANLNAGARMIYNYPGNEYTILYTRRSDDVGHGSILRWGYPDNYIRMIRMISGSPQTSDWEKISAGYADSAGDADKLDGYHIGDLDLRYTRTGWSFYSPSDDSMTGSTDLQDWVTNMYNQGGYKGYSSITVGSWWWVRSLDFSSPAGTIRTSGAMIIYSGDGNSNKNYKHFLVLDAAADLYGITSNEESWEYYSKFLNNRNYTDYVYSKSTSDSRYLRKDTNDSTPYQYTFTKTNDHAIRVGTVRGTAVGSQTGEYIHLYERVAIGSPSGWGSRPAPSYGLATYGGAWLATDTGNVGIGTTNPSQKLHVNGSVYLGKTDLDNTPFTDSLQILANSSNESYNENFNEGNQSFGITFVRDWSSGGYRTKQGGIYSVGSGNWRAGLAFRVKNNTIGNGTHDITAMWMSPIGNIGIGTTTPAYKFHVVGDIYTTTGFKKEGSSDAYVLLGGGGHKVISDFNRSGVDFLTFSTSVAYNLWNRIGYVQAIDAGIGVCFLISIGSHHNSTVHNTLFLCSASYSGKMHIKELSGSHLSLVSIRINSSNNYPNKVYIDLKSESSYTSSGLLYRIKIISLMDAYISAEYLANVSAETYNTTFTSHTEGAFATTGSIYAAHFYENSDIRYKKILKNLLINFNTIANLPLFDFEWIENNTIGTGTSAQAVQKILPNIVSGTDKLTLDYGVLGTIAGITACKELVKVNIKISTLKSEIEQLKEKVKLLEDKLLKYENI